MDDVVVAVLVMLDGHPIPLELNHTYVTLTLKKPKPEKVSNFCSIGLCNIVYKLVTKVILNRFSLYLAPN